jgi:hypothetical protein
MWNRAQGIPALDEHVYASSKKQVKNKLQGSKFSQ